MYGVLSTFYFWKIQNRNPGNCEAGHAPSNPFSGSRMPQAFMISSSPLQPAFSLRVKFLMLVTAKGLHSNLFRRKRGPGRFSDYSLLLLESGSHSHNPADGAVEWRLWCSEQWVSRQKDPIMRSTGWKGTVRAKFTVLLPLWGDGGSALSSDSPPKSMAGDSVQMAGWGLIIPQSLISKWELNSENTWTYRETSTLGLADGWGWGGRTRSRNGSWWFSSNILGDDNLYKGSSWHRIYYGTNLPTCTPELKIKVKKGNLSNRGIFKVSGRRYRYVLCPEAVGWRRWAHELLLAN